MGVSALHLTLSISMTAPGDSSARRQVPYRRMEIQALCNKIIHGHGNPLPLLVECRISPPVARSAGPYTVDFDAETKDEPDRDRASEPE